MVLNSYNVQISLDALIVLMAIWRAYHSSFDPDSDDPGYNNGNVRSLYPRLSRRARVRDIPRPSLFQTEPPDARAERGWSDAE
jgi:hypothetical protein